MKSDRISFTNHKRWSGWHVDHYLNNDIRYIILYAITLFNWQSIPFIFDNIFKYLKHGIRIKCKLAFSKETNNCIELGFFPNKIKNIPIEHKSQQQKLYIIKGTSNRFPQWLYPACSRWQIPDSSNFWWQIWAWTPNRHKQPWLFALYLVWVWGMDHLILAPN